MVCEAEVWVLGQAVFGAELGDDLGLLDRVDAQVCFEFEVCFEFLDIVACLLGHHGGEPGQDLVAGHRRPGRRLGWCRGAVQLGLSGRLVFGFRFRTGVFADPAGNQSAIFHRCIQGIGQPLVLGGSDRAQRPAVQNDPSLGNLELLCEECAIDRFVHSGLIAVRALIEGKGELGSKACRQAQGKVAAHFSTWMEGQVGKFGIRVSQVGDGGHLVLPQTGHHHGIFESSSHGVSRVSLGVDHGHLARCGPEGGSERLGLGLGRSTPGRGVGLVGHKDHVGRKGFSVQSQSP